MSWKTIAVIGGAVILAACDQATAPQPQLQQFSQQKAAANGSKNAPTTTNAPTTVTATTIDCRSGYSVSSGDKDCTQ